MVYTVDKLADQNMVYTVDKLAFIAGMLFKLSIPAGNKDKYLPSVQVIVKN